jgi:hypothetical protein
MRRSVVVALCVLAPIAGARAEALKSSLVCAGKIALTKGNELVVERKASKLPFKASAAKVVLKAFAFGGDAEGSITLGFEDAGFEMDHVSILDAGFSPHGPSDLGGMSFLTASAERAERKVAGLPPNQWVIRVKLAKGYEAQKRDSEGLPSRFYGVAVFEAPPLEAPNAYAKEDGGDSGRNDRFAGLSVFSATEGRGGCAIPFEGAVKASGK